MTCEATCITIMVRNGLSKRMSNYADAGPARCLSLRSALTVWPTPSTGIPGPLLAAARKRSAASARSSTVLNNYRRWLEMRGALHGGHPGVGGGSDQRCRPGSRSPRRCSGRLGRAQSGGQLTVAILLRPKAFPAHFSVGRSNRLCIRYVFFRVVNILRD